MNLSLNREDLNTLDNRYYLSTQYEDRELIVMDKKKFEKIRQMDLSYIDFLKTKSKGQTTISTADELIKRIENEL